MARTANLALLNLETTLGVNTLQWASTSLSVISARFNSTISTAIAPMLLGVAILAVEPHASASAQTVTEQSSTSADLQAALQPGVNLSTYLEPFELPPIEPTLPQGSLQSVRLVLRLSERRVYVYQDEKIQASYPVAVGRSGWETPTGEFEVISLLENPGWTNPFTREVVPPGPTNPLGQRWIGFWTDGTNYIGFHGTPNRSSVGRAASHGCVRMYDEDIRAMYEWVALGTVVTVEP